MHSNLPLVEPIAVADIFISGIADVEEMGDGMFRLLCYALRRNTQDHTTERVVVASLIMSKDTLIRNMFKCAKFVDLSLVAEIANLPRERESMN